MILTHIIDFGLNNMEPKLKVCQSKWNKIWKITKIYKQIKYFQLNLYKICAHSNLDNDGKTQHGFIEGVVPHDI
jgi:hypothetical protein